ncbi:oxidoreductase [Paenibacillus protaetiae]|uniref:Oxidoreductase n=1 Tax=Paenibacillus protaetiae TaxID=2509456 RepID=A0A4P6ESV8_9BACL|nr:oxidoreductase [Paenibacillus protaetiae]QAY65994.1 oxidoreductase [Paenibacillus protaetiae]
MSVQAGQPKLEPFQALVVDKEESGAIHAKLRTATEDELPEGEVLIRVSFSSMNYKDAMALQSSPLIIRSYPMVPGIDYAGTVVRSGSPLFQPGDEVIATGWGAGERQWGGYAEYAVMAAEHLIALPSGLSMRHAMTVGTAGLTAMLCVSALERHGIRPDQGDIIVTGATGGVGSFAILILAAAGYSVAAVSGKLEQADYLHQLGASSIISREEFTALAAKPLGSERWAAGIDTAGGQPLASMLAGIRYGGAVAACGMAAGNKVEASIYPFILRNIALLGIDSVHCPMQQRQEAWQRISRSLSAEQLDLITRDITLEQAQETASRMLAGGSLGRVVVSIL